MTYPRWFGTGFLLFLLLVPVSWWSIGQYFYISWTQASLISGIIIGSTMLYIERTNDPIRKKDTKEDKENE